MIYQKTHKILTKPTMVRQACCYGHPIKKQGSGRHSMVHSNSETQLGICCQCFD